VKWKEVIKKTLNKIAITEEATNAEKVEVVIKNTIILINMDRKRVPKKKEVVVEIIIEAAKEEVAAEAAIINKRAMIKTITEEAQRNIIKMRLNIKSKERSLRTLINLKNLKRKRLLLKISFTSYNLNKISISIWLTLPRLNQMN